MALGTPMWPPMAKANVTAGLACPPETSAAISTAAKSPNACATAVATRDAASEAVLPWEAAVPPSVAVTIPDTTHIPKHRRARQ
jgi:hypothetical protein